MASPTFGSNRREFLRTGLASGVAALFATRFARAAERGAAPAAPQTPVAPAAPAAPATAPSKVALTNGDNRTDNVFRALKSLEKEIAQSIGNRRVVIKPNNVSPNNQLASSHAEALAGICEFLKSIGKIENTIIAESAMGNTLQSFQNFGYDKVAEKYQIKLVDLDQEKSQMIMAFDQTDAMPHPVRVSSLLTNQVDNFIISSCMLKTHDRAVVTLGLKNIVLGAALKQSNPNGGRGGGRGFPGGPGGMSPMGIMSQNGGPGGVDAGDRGRGFGRGPDGPGGMGGRMGGGRRGGRGGFGGSDKPILHGGGAHGICVNLAMLAPLLHPSLTLIDGYEGMEGNGPIGGTKVDHHVCVASTDYLAADCVGASLMGLNPMDVGYLSYLATAKVGESDVTKMEILGESIAKLARKYQLGRSLEEQLQWKTPSRVTAISQS